MTKAELIVDLKNMIGPGVEVDNTGLLTWLNDAYLYMVDEISKNNPEFFTKSSVANTIADQQEVLYLRVLTTGELKVLIQRAILSMVHGVVLGHLLLLRGVQ